MKTIVAGVGVAVLASCGLFGQAAPPPAFEVASIKPAAPQPEGRMMTGTRIDAGLFSATNVTLKNLLVRAYDVKVYQIAGPAWLDSERYDINAKVPDGVPREQIPAMLQTLLADRFHMVVRRETREQSGYALVVAKGGPKLTKSDDSAAAASGGPDGNAHPAPLPPPPPGGRGEIGMIVTASAAGGSSGARGRLSLAISGSTVRMELKGAPLSSLASALSGRLGRPVMDLTGIQGDYDFILDANSDEMGGFRTITLGAAPANGAASPAPEGAPTASVFASIQEYGLRLESRKAPAEFIVVEKADKVPTEN